MTEPNTADHWAALAGNLGAQPGPRSHSRGTPRPKTRPPRGSSRWPRRRFPSLRLPVSRFALEKRPARPAAWDQLAGEFGIEVPPQPVVSETAASRAFGTERASASPPRSEDESHRPVSTSFSEGFGTRTPSPPPPFSEGEENLDPAEIAAEIEAEADRLGRPGPDRDGAAGVRAARGPGRNGRNGRRS